VHARSLAVALWRRRGTALVVLVLVLAAAGLWLGFAPRKYTAVATITTTLKPGVQQSERDDVEATLAALANSRSVLQDVRDQVGMRRSLATLQQEVRGTRIGGTVLIRIAVEDADAAFARRVANAVADTLPLHDPTGGNVVFTDAGRATTPQSPSSPDVAPLALLAVAAGLVLAAAAGLTREALAGRVERVDQLDDVPVLGVVARPSDPSTMPVLRTGASTDDFRRLRVALEFAGSMAVTRTIVVAPACADPAAGWLTVNLAASLAEVEHRVLLIDADFGDRKRHPVLASKADGLVDVLAGRAGLEQAIVESDVPGVSVLPVGDLDTMAAPAALVELRFHALVRAVSEDDFDIVLVHVAPLDEAVDALVLAAGNSLLLTVPAGRMRAKALRTEIDGVRRMHLRLIGTVLLAPGHKRR
jgi:succinoglycan biosynthesis transport protein ExoP